ncbi:brain protein I3 [Chytriomyces cf. hyalinus JEL632]|nr:brain protein I3 [Chytriomyces cf. hyalinus JEL632]
MTEKDEQPPVTQTAPPPIYGPSKVHPESAAHQVHTTVICLSPCGFCRMGGEHVLDKSFTALGACLGICCFPIGIICCIALMETRCVKCGEVFG